MAKVKESKLNVDHEKTKVLTFKGPKIRGSHTQEGGGERKINASVVIFLQKRNFNIGKILSLFTNNFRVSFFRDFPYFNSKYKSVHP